jgi:hypothetical protein
MMSTSADMSAIPILREVNIETTSVAKRIAIVGKQASATAMIFYTATSDAPSFRAGERQ